jgi:O-antigen/teichoic acid export membrane protein
MGLFNAAKQWHVLILYLPNTLSNMTLPILSNLLGEGERHQFNRMVVMNLIGLTGLAFVVSMPVALFSGSIMGAYGSDFAEGQYVLLLVCVYSVLWAANIVIGQVLWSTGSSGLAMLLAAVRAVILLSCFMFITPRNAFGIALAYTITYALQTVYQGILSVKSIDKGFLVRSSNA